MRKLIVCGIASLDGYFEGPGRNVMALPMNPAFDDYNLERLRAADTLLLGRTTYEGFRSYWPPVADDPTASATNREISRINGTIDKVVVSDTLEPDPAQPWDAATTIVRRSAAHERVAELKRGPGRDILMFGSRAVWSDLLVHGLVDELHVWVGAVVLGGGTPLFDGAPPVTLKLIDARTSEGCDNVLVRYAVS